MNRDVTSGNLETFSKEPSILPTDIIVAGALAVDFSCDFAPLPGSLPALAPQLYTSNPATISQSLGGVAHNIARASHYMGVSVKLCSVVGGDLTGKAAIGQLSAQGMQTDGVQIMPSESGQRTAQYVAINDAKKSLMVAMADMSILENISDELLVAWSNSLRQDKPKWVVVDANWSPEILHEWITTAKEAGAHVAFEPVSAPKSTRLFGSESGKLLSVFPQNKIDIATPNILELAAMHTAAQQAGLFDRQDWWEVIDSLGIPSTGARTKYAMAVGAELVDRGVPQQNVQLLPFIPCILTKLGTRGVLLTRLLPAGDDRLISPEAAPYILATSEARETVGGVYMRLFPPAQVVPDEEVVSVNGVGDTFLGVLVAGLLRRKGARVEDLIELAQKGSALTLKSRESVSPEVGSLRALMD